SAEHKLISSVRSGILSPVNGLKEKGTYKYVVPTALKNCSPESAGTLRPFPDGHETSLPARHVRTLHAHCRIDLSVHKRERACRTHCLHHPQRRDNAPACQSASEH